MGYDYSVSGIRRDYERFNGGHWFDADTMRFWQTRLSQRVFVNRAAPSRVYFITSDQPDRALPRRYSVRAYDFTDHEIDTVSRAEDATLAAALKRAAFIAGRGAR